MRNAQRSYVEAFADAVRSTFGTSKTHAVNVVLGVISLIHTMAQRSNATESSTPGFIRKVALGAFKVSALSKTQ
jgi:hypothetical protein